MRKVNLILNIAILIILIASLVVTMKLVYMAITNELIDSKPTQIITDGKLQDKKYFLC
jgi:uncharacterized membrane protein YcaP (DUF421 family)